MEPGQIKSDIISSDNESEKSVAIKGLMNQESTTEDMESDGGITITR